MAEGRKWLLLLDSQDRPMALTPIDAIYEIDFFEQRRKTFVQISYHDGEKRIEHMFACKTPSAIVSQLLG